MSGIRFGALLTLLFCAVVMQSAWAGDEDVMTLSDIDQATVKNLFLRPVYNGPRPPFTPEAEIQAAGSVENYDTPETVASVAPSAAEPAEDADAGTSAPSVIYPSADDSLLPQLPVRRDLPPYDFLFDNW